MKILVAIESSENPKTLASHTLRWAGRAGFNMRIFIPDEVQRAAYEQAVNEANHNWYLDLPQTVIVAGKTPKEFGKAGGFDLVLYLPDNLRKWTRYANHDLNVMKYATEVAAARVRFGNDPNKKDEHFSNGAIMIRL